MASDESIARICSERIRKRLDDYGLGEIAVCDTIERRAAHDFDGLTIAHFGIGESSPIILASSEGATYGSYPIHSLLIPPHPGSLVIHDDSIGAQFFYEIRDGRIAPVHTDEPVPLDCANILYHTTQPGIPIPPRVLLNGKGLMELANDKFRSKKVFERSGIKVPRGELVEGTMLGQPAEAIRRFLRAVDPDGFVIKPVDGSQGKGVKLFENDQLAEAVAHLRRLAWSSKRVILEERINPIRWETAGVLIDWNLRSITTYGPDPVFVDAEIRFGPRNGKPINLSIDADAIEVEWLFRVLGISYASLRDESVKATRALYSSLARDGPQPHGIVGHDQIIRADGIYFNETNAGAVGGFSTLAGLRQGRVRSIKERLLPGIGPFLLENHRRRGPLHNGAGIPAPTNTILNREDLARIFTKRGEHRSALSIYQSLHHESKDPEYLACLSECYIRLGLPKKAKACMELFSEANKELITSAQAKAICDSFLANRQPAEAVHLVESLISKQPDDLWIHELAAFIYNSVRNPAEALHHARRSLELDPTRWESWHNVGASMTNLGNPEEAIPYYQKALAMNPDATPYGNLGRTLFKLGRKEEAEEALEKCVELNPGAGEAHLYLGLCAYRDDMDKDRIRQGIASIQRAIHLEPNAPYFGFALTHLGFLHLFLQDEKHALPYFREAKEGITPAQRLYYLGYCHERLRRPYLARKFFHRAISADNKYGEPYAALICMEWAGGAFKRAERIVERWARASGAPHAQVSRGALLAYLHKRRPFGEEHTGLVAAVIKGPTP